MEYTPGRYGAPLEAIPSNTALPRLNGFRAMVCEKCTPRDVQPKGIRWSNPARSGRAAVSEVVLNAGVAVGIPPQGTTANSTGCAKAATASNHKPSARSII